MSVKASTTFSESFIAYLSTKLSMRKKKKKIKHVHTRKAQET